MSNGNGSGGPVQSCPYFSGKPNEGGRGQPISAEPFIEGDPGHARSASIARRDRFKANGLDPLEFGGREARYLRRVAQSRYEANAEQPVSGAFSSRLG